MRKVVSFFAVLALCATAAMAQLNHYQCGAVDNADAIFGIDVANFNKAPAVVQIKQMLAPFLKNDPKNADDDMKEIKQFFNGLGITADNYDKVVLHAMFTIAFNGASLENPDPAKLDAIAAALLAAPINFENFPQAIKPFLEEEDLADTTVITKKQYKNAVAFELLDKAEDATAGADKVTIALVKQNVIFLGPTKSVEKALDRVDKQQAPKTSNMIAILSQNLDRILTRYLNRVDKQQAPKNMDPFLFGQDGQIQFAIRMFPEMKQGITSMAASIPGAAALANSKGLAILFNATDKFSLNMNLQTAKPEDAANFKKQVWDVQVAPMLGAFSQMAKAQTNNQFTALDSIKCTVKDAVLGISASFTFNDIIQGVAAVQKIQAAQTQAEKKADAPQAVEQEQENEEEDEEDDEE